MRQTNGSYPTSKDVAKKAGVSQSIVSLVMNGKEKGRVSQETRDRVIRSAEELGYTINTTARNLRMGSTMTIGFVVPNIENPVYIPAIKKATEMLRQYGYTLLLLDVGHDLDWLKLILNTQASQAVDGFILFSLDLKNEEIPDFIKGKFISIDSDIDDKINISLDFYNNVTNGLRYLIELGHRNIAHITIDVDRRTLVDRRRAYLDVMAEYKICVKPQYYLKSLFSLDDVTSAVEQLIKQHPEVSAIFCDDDFFAVGVYKAARNLGIKIPSELSVLSINDTDIARVLTPELTVLSIPSAKLGELGVLQLMNLLKGEKIIKEGVMELPLIIRGSTAPAVKRG